MRIQNRLAGFYFFYYAIVGTFMPYWNLYLEDQGFNYAEIGFLASLAIITRFFAPFIWGGLQINRVKGCSWSGWQLGLKPAFGY